MPTKSGYRTGGLSESQARPIWIPVQRIVLICAVALTLVPRAFPDDPYGIVLKNPTELGDDQLGGALLAWGLGKAKVLRARAGGDAGLPGGTA